MSDDPLIATPSQTVGPFFHFGLTVTPYNCLYDSASAAPSVPLIICVTDGDGLRVTDALVELRHNGFFGRMPTGPDGCCDFNILGPAVEDASTRSGAAPHVLVCLHARGLLRQLHSRIYFAGDPRLDTDPVLQLVPPDRRDTLLATRDQTPAAGWRFELRLQGDQETVFFNV